VDAPPEPTAYLRLRIADAALAIEAPRVEQVVDLGTTVPLPRAPRHIMGLARVGDGVVPVIALDALANIGRPDDLQRVVIIEHDGMRAGLACDEVVGITEISRGAPHALERSRDLPGFFTHEHHDAAGPVLVLDAKRLFAAARVRKR
jgi:purine-binding chemotaxis protein CheW